MPDDYISQFSGEEIDSAVRAAQIISGASTLAELRKKLEIRGDTIPVSASDSTLISEALTKIPTTSSGGGGVNPNLLDNWYFGRPVNQRGQTEYTAGGVYTLDRWWAQYDTTLSIVDGGIKIGGKWDVQQYFETTLPNATYTLSLLYKDRTGSDPLRLLIGNRTDGDLAQTESKDASGILSITFSTAVLNKVNFGFAGSTDNSATIIAIKLELGDTQTLAHKENEKWVLNEIPDFGEQLRRCQRYFVRLTNAYGYGWTYSSSVANFLVPLPTTLRANPVVKLTKNGEIQTINGSKAVTGFEAKGIHPNGLAIDLHDSANALISGTPVTWHDSSMDISADL
jgi:hypothetical protein